MVDSTEFAQVLSEANDIAQSVSQRVTSAHVLLALFTVENRAALLLKERGADEDRFLSVLTAAPTEPENALRELCDRARDIAKSCNAKETDCLHLLVAATRVRCAAWDLLSRSGLDLGTLRNTALSYLLSGHMPRKLQPGRATGPRPVPRPLGSPRVRPQTAAVTLSPRDLVDETDEHLAPSSAPAVEQEARLWTEPAVLAQAAPAPQPATQPNHQPDHQPHHRIAFDDPAAGLDARLYPLLVSLGRNLSELARHGKLDPVVGRSREIEEVIDILGKRRTNNPVLLGDPGVGKTAIVEGVALLLSQGGQPGERIIVEIEVAALVAGTQLRGSFSEKLNALKEEVRRAAGRVVVFIDELHTLVGAGATGEGPQDAANELKAAMARGEFPCIGATTHDEFRKFIQNDPALERRFTSVVVREPSVPETEAILRGVVQRYADHHGLSYAPESLVAAAALSARYITDRFLPDKALSVIDLTGSRARREGKSRVEPDDVARVVAKWAGLPEARLLQSDSARLLGLEEALSERVIGHADVMARIASVVRRNYAGFASRRPMGSFLFLGPTGVGKTELARTLADVLFDSADALVRLDLSEASEAHGVSRLIGAPAGYVGYGDGGQLTEPIRRRPSSVVLLDEIEKAHRDVLMLLLQVLDEGRLTDGRGRHVDFSNAVIVLTTNLGSEAFTERDRRVGFGSGPSETSAAQDALAAAKRALPLELWNRIDERCVFAPLTTEQVGQVAERLLAESSERLQRERGIRFVAASEVVHHLLQSGGFDAQLGARPMRQTVQRLVEAPLAERILAGDFASGDEVQVRLDTRGALAFSSQRRA
ncbi:MAG: AAA family ATPase [Myxococcaceae bacterium]